MITDNTAPLTTFLDAQKVIALSRGITNKVTPPSDWKLASNLSIWDMSSDLPDITKQSGPIINDPQLYNVFIGDWTSASAKERMKRLDQFTTDLVNSSYMTMLAQYGCTLPGKFVKSVVVPVATKEFTDSSLQQLLQNIIGSLQLPEPKPNDVFMVYLADDMYVKDAGLQINLCNPDHGNAFGYHHFFNTAEGNRCYYAVIPGLTDACLNGTCYGEINCSLKLLQSQEERQTQVASHEIIEVITNPESNAWYDVLHGGEVADICNGYTDTIKVGDNTWHVQQIYSKNDDLKTSGKTVCLAKTEATAPAPTGSAAGSILGRLQPDLNSKYNLLGGVALMTIIVLIGGKSIVGKIAFGIFAFGAGFFLTDVIRQSLTTEQKDLVKDSFKKIGKIAS